MTPPWSDPVGKLNCPTPEPNDPFLQGPGAEQISKPVPPLGSTSQPNIKTKFPDEVNFWTRRLVVSDTYTLPEGSTEIPVGILNCPAPMPDKPEVQVKGVEQISKPVPPPVSTSQPKVKRKPPDESNFWIRLLSSSTT